MVIDFKVYLIVLFDDSIITIFDTRDMKVAHEFSIKYHFDYKNFLE